MKKFPEGALDGFPKKEFPLSQEEIRERLKNISLSGKIPGRDPETIRLAILAKQLVKEGIPFPSCREALCSWWNCRHDTRTCPYEKEGECQFSFYATFRGE